MNPIDQLKRIFNSGALAQAPALQILVRAVLDQQATIDQLAARIRALEEDSGTLVGPAI